MNNHNKIDLYFITKSTMTESQYNLLLDKKEDKKNITKVCYVCLFYIILFTSCFFLIPREPYLYFENVIVNNNTLTGNFKLKNNNYYNMYWKNPQINLYWVPNDGDEINDDCYNNNPCNKMCEYILGEFHSEEHYQTPMLSTKSINLKMYFPDEYCKYCYSSMLINTKKNSYERLLTKGKIKAKSDITQFSNVHTTETYYYLYLN